MKTMKIWRLALAILAAFSLVSCSSDDDDKDITKEIIMNVSAVNRALCTISSTAWESIPSSVCK